MGDRRVHLEVVHLHVQVSSAWLNVFGIGWERCWKLVGRDWW